ncbi:hypothetical protein JCM5176_02560 [Streptococcus sobrinus]|uniref:Uncharacterized protein n=1 Tax=Streptococcus sobrinus W1703 TaxID=1227275 RepID=U2IVV9_9STRE|nr:hypothetical protein HMPREF1557_00398 [Streptococcus sobrinus W1703]
MLVDGTSLGLQVDVVEVTDKDKDVGKNCIVEQHAKATLAKLHANAKKATESKNKTINLCQGHKCRTPKFNSFSYITIVMGFRLDRFPGFLQSFKLCYTETKR